MLKPGITLCDWLERLSARLQPARPIQPEWLPWSTLMAAGIEPWQSYPTLLPCAQAEFAGYGSISAEAAIVHGLNFRPLEETAADLAHWLAIGPAAGGGTCHDSGRGDLAAAAAAGAQSAIGEVHRAAATERGAAGVNTTREGIPRDALSVYPCLMVAE